jgi:hypothetical protein
MGKVSPYSLGNISLDLEQFRDEVTNIINLGKNAPPIVTSLPAWNAITGEEAIFAASSGGHTSYRYFGSAWVSTWSVSV